MKLYTQEIVESLAKSLEGFETKATEKDYIIKDIVMTTNATDRHNEVVLQEGIDLTEFKNNPVALIDHNYTLNAIAGVWFNLRQEGGQTVGDCRLIDTEAGNLVKTLHMAGAVKDISIGFIAKEREGNVITKAELIECSFVVVGSNRGAKLKEILGTEYAKLKDAGVIVEDDEYPECVRPLEADGTVSEEEKACRMRKRKENEGKKEFSSKELNEMKKDISEIKEFLKKLVDGKTKTTEELEQKELLQTIARSANEALRSFGKKQ